MQLVNLLTARAAQMNNKLLDGNCFSGLSTIVSIPVQSQSHDVSTNRVYLLIYCFMHISDVDMLRTRVFAHDIKKESQLGRVERFMFEAVVDGATSSSNDMTSSK